MIIFGKGIETDFRFPFPIPFIEQKKKEIAGDFFQIRFRFQRYNLRKEGMFSLSSEMLP